MPNLESSSHKPETVNKIIEELRDLRSYESYNETSVLEHLEACFDAYTRFRKVIPGHIGIALFWDYMGEYLKNIAKFILEHQLTFTPQPLTLFLPILVEHGDDEILAAFIKPFIPEKNDEENNFGQYNLILNNLVNEFHRQINFILTDNNSSIRITDLASLSLNNQPRKLPLDLRRYDSNFKPYFNKIPSYLNLTSINNKIPDMNLIRDLSSLLRDHGLSEQSALNLLHELRP